MSLHLVGERKPVTDINPGLFEEREELLKRLSTSDEQTWGETYRELLEVCARIDAAHLAAA